MNSVRFIFLQPFPLKPRHAVLVYTGQHQRGQLGTAGRKGERTVEFFFRSRKFRRIPGVQPCQHIALFHRVARFFQQADARRRVDDALFCFAPRAQQNGCNADFLGVGGIQPAVLHAHHVMFIRGCGEA